MNKHSFNCMLRVLAGAWPERTHLLMIIQITMQDLACALDVRRAKVKVKIS